MHKANKGTIKTVPVLSAASLSNRLNVKELLPQPTITCSKSTIETLGQGVNFEHI